jgi:uncharacterized protein YciI
MGKQQFYMRIIPPRPTFAQDMTDQERALMIEHAAYVRGFFEAGKVLAYGPVLDPEGSFGVGLLEMADLAEAEQFASNDPSVKCGMNRYTLAPMRIAASQTSRGD